MSLIGRKRKRRYLKSPRFFRLFRRNAEALSSKGNRVELFPQGASFFPALLNALNEAEDYIFLEFYIVREDIVGRSFADALLGAVNRGVEVFLIYDYIGCFDTPSSYFRRLQDGGVRCLPFNPPPFRRGFGWFDKRDHRKIAVIDGTTAFAGGINIGSEYSGAGESFEKWRDLGMRIYGPAAGDLEKVFRNNWEGESGHPLRLGSGKRGIPPPSGEADVLIVSGGPLNIRSLIRSAFRLAIAGAGDKVRVLNPYFVPGPRIIRSLLRAAARGVRVQLVLPARSDVPIVRLVSRSYYAQLLKGGIEIYEREGTVLHAKVMLIDDFWAVIGSANLDQRSFNRNFEVNVIVDSREFGEQVASMIDDDLKRSRRIVFEEHERRGMLTRMLEKALAPISWFL